MQHKIKLLNKEQDWSRLKNYRPNEVVNHNGKQWQNVTGLNSEPSDSSFDWVNIDFNKGGNTDNALLKPEEDGNLDDFPYVVGINREADTAFLPANSFGKVDAIRHNGILVEVINKVAQIITATKTSQLTNDSNFTNKEYVDDELRMYLTVAGAGLYTDIITPTSEVPAEVGDKVFLVTQPGTYTNFGNVVLPENNFGFIFKNGNNFSIQSVEIPMQDLTDLENRATPLISWFNPLVLKTENLNRDYHPVFDFPMTTNAKALACMTDVLNEEKLINSISQFIWATSPGQSVTVKVYATSASQPAWTPSEATTVLLAEKTISNWNTNPNKRAYVLFDSFKNVKGKRLVIIWESGTNNLRICRNEASTGLSIMERREPQNNYYLDSSGRYSPFPIIEYLTDEQQNSFSYDLSRIIFIPKIVHAVVGSELNIYHANVLNIPNGLKQYKVRFRNVTSTWTGTGDTSGIYNYTDRLRVIPVTAGQSYQFVCELLDVKNHIVASKDFEIRTIAKKISVTGQKNFVVFGDSTIEYISSKGNTARNLYEMLLANTGITPKMVGSKTTDTEGVFHEGYSGQSIGFFIGPTSPFNIGGELNFKSYATAKGVEKLDFIIGQIGINDVGSGIKQDYTYFRSVFFPNIIAGIKQFVDVALSVDKGFPDAKIIISLQPFGADGENFMASRSTDELKRKMFHLFNLIYDNFYNDGITAKYHTNVWLAPSYLSIDRVYGYPFVMQAPNLYDDSGTTVFQHTDTIHPNSVGFKQVASVFHNYVQLLLS